MKTSLSRTALLLATVFTFGYSRAASPFEGNTAGATNDRTHLERVLDQQLSRHLSFPLMQKADMTGVVTVAFAINTEGRVQVLDIQGSNEALKQYVMKKLAKVDVGENPNGVWKTTYLRLVFKPEQV
jgi:outer membrane biosynthesis protein TonB